MDFETITHDLISYKRNMKRLLTAQDELEALFYDLTGVKGVGYDQQGGSTNTLQKALNWHTMDEKYNAKLNEVIRYQTALRNVETIKKKLPKELWEMLSDKFIKGMTYTEVGLKYGYSRSGVWYMMRQETERYL